MSSTLPDTTRTSETPASKPGLPASHFIVLWVPILLALYVLSIGPLWKLSDKGLISSHTVNVIYRPLTPLAAHFGPAQQFFTWYIFDLWHCHLVHDAPAPALSLYQIPLASISVHQPPSAHS